jgi:hypothetical protein
MQITKPDPTRWAGRTVIVAAPGPSLTEEVADACRGFPTIVVNDAWRRLPWADVLFACDTSWWQFYRGVPAFNGEKWSSHGTGNDKQDPALSYDIKLIAGTHGSTFSTKPGFIHWGSNSGFQAINLAIQFGAPRIVLVGFNMQKVGGKNHFHGDHPRPLRNADPVRFITYFNQAAKQMPPGVTIINATPDSALKCFPWMPLEQALAEAREAA